MVEFIAVSVADWDYENAKPQEFQEFENYAIAVGTEEKPEIVQVADIHRAIDAEKEIRLFNVVIKEGSDFGGIKFVGDASCNSRLRRYRKK